MAAKSDFAQKLLGDLRLRKEKMAAGQGSSRTSRVMHGKSGQTSTSARRIIESAKSTTGNTSRRSNGSSRSVNTKESSNQIVLYEGGHNSRQVKDLSMAIAFAFENNGNLSKISSSSRNPLVNFFNRFGRRSLNTKNIEITTFNNQSLPNGQLPTVSNIHVTEILKGVHKLNQILRTCSNGHNFDRNSIEVGKELMRGAMDLEESLRMLLSFQDGSQKKSRLKLLEEDEDEEDDVDVKWKPDRPQFSFDKHSRRRKQLALPYINEISEQPMSNSKVVLHERSRSHIQELNLTVQVNNSPQSTREKGRISNVLAKLMGLEEIPVNNDPKGEEDKEREANVRTQPIREPKIQHKPEKSKERNQQQKDLNEQAVGVEKSRRFKAAHTRHSSIEQEMSANSMEKRIKIADKDQHKLWDQHALIQEQVRKRGAHSEEKRRVATNGQQFQKQNLKAKGNQVEPIIASKSKRNTATNGQKKLPDDKSTPEKVHIRDPPNKRHQDTSARIDISQNTETDQLKNTNKNESQCRNLSTREPEIDTKTSNKVQSKEMPIEVQAPRKMLVSRKVQRSEIPQKIDVLITRRNAQRSLKKPANMLKDLKQQMHMKNCSSKRMEDQPGDSMVKERNIGITVDNAPEMIVKLKEKLQNECEQTHLSSTGPDECQLQNTDSLNDNDFKTMEQSSLFKDEELKQHDQILESHKECTELYPTLKREEQLTEPEKHLKETLIKSQLFLSTAEALFKLNIPLSFLHPGDQTNETAETRLMLDCAYEVMKRKARRREVAYNPYVKNTMSSSTLRSLDDMVKQLCKDLEMLKFYGKHESDVAAGLYKMLNKDIYSVNPDVNSMWDYEWRQTRCVFPQMEDVAKDVERHMLNGLLDEITDDLFFATVLS